MLIDYATKELDWSYLISDPFDDRPDLNVDFKSSSQTTLEFEDNTASVLVLHPIVIKSTLSCSALLLPRCRPPGTKMANLTSMPPEIKHEIIRELDPLDVVALSETCNVMQRFVKGNKLWARDVYLRILVSGDEDG